MLILSEMKRMDKNTQRAYGESLVLIIQRKWAKISERSVSDVVQPLLLQMRYLIWKIENIITGKNESFSFFFFTVQEIAIICLYRFWQLYKTHTTIILMMRLVFFSPAKVTQPSMQ